MQETLTPQQEKIRKSMLNSYKELAVGDGNLLSLFAFEFYETFISNIGGFLGYGLRYLYLKLVLKSFGFKNVVGKGFRFKMGKSIKIANSCIFDDNVFLDARDRKEDKEETKKASIKIADKCFIGRNTLIAAKGASIELASGANISSNCRIASQSKISIGENTLIAAYCYIGPGNHALKKDGTLDISSGMIDKGGVKIGKNVWIGTKTTILDGVTIGDNAIIGAYSLVNKDVPTGAKVAGIPSKAIS